MSHQDWTPQILNKSKAPLITDIIAKEKNVLNPSVKLDENDEVIKIKTVPKDTSTMITNARNLRKLTRKDLANKLNLKEDIITNIETGKAIYDGNQIAKIKRFLGI
tara:strand:+ start:1617 stop:1934 length:318 start_codon:yes stop_codon:yes gene_type:complete